jgi:hypothetical protein
MSGSCSGYYDNTTLDGLAVGRLGVKRSRRVTCAASAAVVTYQEFAGLGCSGDPYFNATYDVRLKLCRRCRRSLFAWVYFLRSASSTRQFGGGRRVGCALGVCGCAPT